MIVLNLELLVKEKIRNSLRKSILQEYSDYYLPGYGDDVVSDYLGDIKKKSSKVHCNAIRKLENTILKKDSKSVLKTLKTTESANIAYKKFIFASIVTTSLQMGLYIDEDLFKKAMNYYREALQNKELKRSMIKYGDWDSLSTSIKIILDEMESMKPLQQGYYAPYFMLSSNIPVVKI